MSDYEQDAEALVHQLRAEIETLRFREEVAAKGLIDCNAALTRARGEALAREAERDDTRREAATQWQAMLSAQRAEALAEQRAVRAEDRVRDWERGSELLQGQLNDLTQERDAAVADNAALVALLAESVEVPRYDIGPEVDCNVCEAVLVVSATEKRPHHEGCPIGDVLRGVHPGAALLQRLRRAEAVVEAARVAQHCCEEACSGQRKVMAALAAYDEVRP